MRCLVPAAAFSTVNADATLCQFHPRLVIFLQARFAKLFPVHLAGPDGCWAAVRVFISPRGLVVGDLTWKISTATLGNVQVVKLWRYLITHFVPVGNYDVVGIGRTDGLRCAEGDTAVQFARNRAAGSVLIVEV